MTNYSENAVPLMLEKYGVMWQLRWWPGLVVARWSRWT